MHFQQIDLDPLVRFRKSIRMGWRLPVIVVFTYFAYVWWLKLVVSEGQSAGEAPFPFGASWEEYYGTSVRSTWLFLGAILSMTALALFRRDGVGRLFFALISAFCGLQAVLILAAIAWFSGSLAKDGAQQALILGAVLLAGAFAWFFFLRYSWWLWLSLLPLERGRLFRSQVLTGLQVQELNKQATRARAKPRLRSDSYTRGHLWRFLTWGSLAFLLGLVGLAAAQVLMEEEMAETAADLGMDTTAHWIQVWVDAVDSRFESATARMIFIVALWTTSLFSISTAGFLATYWRKSRIVIHRASPGERLQPESVLLLRHSRDDGRSIPRHWFGLFKFDLADVIWRYTFEELLAARLAFVGPLQSLGSRRDMEPIFAEFHRRALAWTSQRASRPWRWIEAAANRLMSLLPQHLPPTGGGTRIYLENAAWWDFVRRSLPEARAVIVLVGDARDGQLVSTSLADEMEWLRDHDHLEKTLFLLPPGLSQWRLKARWQTFTAFLLGNDPPPTGWPPAKRVLGVCFHDRKPVLLLGSKKTGLYYESALDLAGSLIAGCAHPDWKVGLSQQV